MTLSPVSVESFRGLNLSDDPGTVGWGGAIDLLNVDFDQRGRVRSRDGSTALNAVAAASELNHGAIWQNQADIYIIADSSGNTLRAYGSDGVQITTLAAGSTYNVSIASLGTTSAGPYAYIGGSASNQIRRFDGTNFSSPAGMPTAAFVAVQPVDNRLVAANCGTDYSRVKFSDAGAPETWGANNYVDLYPNDGERIRGMVAWRDLLFVFKQSRFFIFYGNSTDSSGNPIFNYRTVDTGIGWNYSQTAQPICATTRAVYFAHSSGIYRSTGGPPEKVSGPLDPIFTGSGSPFFAQAPSTTVTNISKMVASDHRVYFRADFNSGDTALIVYDEQTDQWFAWDTIGWLYAATTWTDGTPRLLFLRSSGIREYIYITDPFVTTDAGTAITSRYRSGFSDLGSPDRKRVPFWRTVGTGASTLKLSTDFGSLEAGATMTMGTSPAIAEATRKYSVVGRMVGYQIGGTSAWTLNSLTAEFADKKGSGQ